MSFFPFSMCQRKNKKKGRKYVCYFLNGTMIKRKNKDDQIEKK